MELINSKHVKSFAVSCFTKLVILQHLSYCTCLKCFFIFNWRIMAYNVGAVSCCTTAWISYKEIYMSSIQSLSPPHLTPLGRHRGPGWPPCVIQQLLCTCVLSCFSRVQLCEPVDCSPPGSPVHGILQARRLEWGAMPSSRRSSRPRTAASNSYVSDTWCAHVSATFSIRPALSSPALCTSAFSTTVSLSLCKQVHQHHFSRL